MPMPKPEQPASWRPFIKPPAQAKEKEEPPLNLDARAQAFLKRIAPLSADLAAHGRTRALALEETPQNLPSRSPQAQSQWSTRPQARSSQSTFLPPSALWTNPGNQDTCARPTPPSAATASNLRTRPTIFSWPRSSATNSWAQTHPSPVGQSYKDFYVKTA